MLMRRSNTKSADVPLLFRFAKTMKQRRWRLAGAAMLVGTLAVTAATLAVENELQRLGPPSLATAQDVSTVVIDRDGKLLRAFTTSEGRWRLPVTRAEVFDFSAARLAVVPAAVAARPDLGPVVGECALQFASERHVRAEVR